MWFYRNFRGWYKLGDGTKLVEIFMPKDVVIDSALAADSCTGCRNFTIAHEAAHHILADLFPNDYGKAVKCRGHIAYRERDGQPSWEEWQANTLAEELLMPTFLVNAEIERAALCLPNGILYQSVSDPNYKKFWRWLHGWEYRGLLSGSDYNRCRS